MAERGITERSLQAGGNGGGNGVKAETLQQWLDDPILIPRKDVEDCIKDAGIAARRTKRTHYVGAIGFRATNHSSLGFTDDLEMLEKLGKVWATVTPTGVIRHA